MKGVKLVSLKVKLTEEQQRLFKATAGHLPENADARQAFAQAFGPLLRKTVPPNATVRDIFDVVDSTSSTET